MVYQLMGGPARVIGYPDGEHNIFGGRTKKTKKFYNHGLGIIRAYQDRANYWANKAPYISAVWALEGALVARTVKDKYAGGKADEAGLDNLAVSLTKTAKEQMEKALQVPTEKIISYARANASLLYSEDMQGLNKAMYEYGQMEASIKDSGWNQLLSTLNTHLIGFCIQLHTSNLALQPEVSFAQYDSGGYAIHTEDNILTNYLKNELEEFAKAAKDFIAGQVRSEWVTRPESKYDGEFFRSYNGEQYKEMRQAIVDSNADALGKIGAMAATMEAEFKKFFEGVEKALLSQRNTGSFWA